MVIPWVGFPLGGWLAGFDPKSTAKYVALETIYDDNNYLPGQNNGVLE
ncbi:MAG: DMSO/TMAO reductase YedYZ molybdopterin-dependent catalytic subunit [Candidatus Endobugula sp.]|jgi:DMSO/TMAO reductase YedYZ molybdopterin-dependent catalytic subunit